MSVNFSTGYLDIDNREDRNTVAAILFKNGYTVSPVKTKKMAARIGILLSIAVMRIMEKVVRCYES